MQSKIDWRGYSSAEFDALKRNKTIRVLKSVAKKMLLENTTVMFGGTVYWLQIKDVGLGVCEVCIAPKRFSSTKLVKEFEL